MSTELKDKLNYFEDKGTDIQWPDMDANFRMLAEAASKGGIEDWEIESSSTPILATEPFGNTILALEDDSVTLSGNLDEGFISLSQEDSVQLTENYQGVYFNLDVRGSVGGIYVALSYKNFANDDDAQAVSFVVYEDNGSHLFGILDVTGAEGGTFPAEQSVDISEFVGHNMCFAFKRVNNELVCALFGGQGATTSSSPMLEVHTGLPFEALDRIMLYLYGEAALVQTASPPFLYDGVSVVAETSSSVDVYPENRADKTFRAKGLPPSGVSSAFGLLVEGALVSFNKDGEPVEQPSKAVELPELNFVTPAQLEDKASTLRDEINLRAPSDSVNATYKAEMESIAKEEIKDAGFSRELVIIDQSELVHGTDSAGIEPELGSTVVIKGKLSGDYPTNYRVTYPTHSYSVTGNPPFVEVAYDEGHTFTVIVDESLEEQTVFVHTYSSHAKESVNLKSGTSNKFVIIDTYWVLVESTSLTHEDRISTLEQNGAGSATNELVVYSGSKTANVYLNVGEHLIHEGNMADYFPAFTTYLPETAGLNKGDSAELTCISKQKDPTITDPTSIAYASIYAQSGAAINGTNTYFSSSSDLSTTTGDYGWYIKAVWSGNASVGWLVTYQDLSTKSITNV